MCAIYYKVINNQLYVELLNTVLNNLNNKMYKNT